ncbi:ribonuclease H-like domain-containing protein, partial [Tanacetum coccineum]
MTYRVLLRCDSMGDLYLITKPSVVPHAFLTSQYTWHKRLGHPGSEVLRRVLPSNSILSNRHPERLNIHVSSIYPLPNSYVDAFNNPNWQNAMNDEYTALIENNTWTLAPRHAEANIVRCMWLFCHKYLADGTLSHYKARLMANGSTQRTDTAYLLLYVDDIVLTASSELLLQQIIDSLHQEFSMTDLNSLNYFFGISVTRNSSWMFLSQRKTPINTESKLRDDGGQVSDPTLYQSLAGSLQCLTFTCINISYAVQQVCLYMHDPHEPYFSALKWILRYVRGTLDHGLQLFSSSTTSLVVYSNADWAGCPTTQRSTSVYCIYLGNNLLSWSSKRQPMLSRSSTEAVYCDVANAVAETCWLRNVLRELHTPLSFATLVYCDNVRVLHVPSLYQYADIFTKGLPSVLFEEFCSSLSVRCPSLQLRGS